MRIPVNVVDDPVHCTFIVPAVISRGEILIAISTGGQSPALAKALRKRLQQEIGPEYPTLLKMIGAIRRRIIPLWAGDRRKTKRYLQSAASGGCSRGWSAKRNMPLSSVSSRKSSDRVSH